MQSSLVKKKVNMLRLLYDRIERGNKNMLIAEHKGRLITGMKLTDKELRKYALKNKPLCDIAKGPRLPECHSTNCTIFEARTLEITSYATLPCSRTVTRRKDTDTCWHSRITQRSGAGCTRCSEEMNFLDILKIW